MRPTSAPPHTPSPAQACSLISRCSFLCCTIFFLNNFILYLFIYFYIIFIYYICIYCVFFVCLVLFCNTLIEIHNVFAKNTVYSNSEGFTGCPASQTILQSNSSTIWSCLGMLHGLAKVWETTFILCSWVWFAWGFY